MLIIVIGQAGSGKTTYVKKNFINQDYSIISDIVPCTVSGKNLLIGKYNIGIRTEGTDCLPYNSIDKILLQVKKSVHDPEIENVVAEGDRINNERFFRFCILNGFDCKMYFLYCSLETSMRRLRGSGSKISLQFVKATKTKSLNNYLRYGSHLNGEAINTEGWER